MRLIFNAEALRPPITGIGNYSYHLLRALVAGALVDDTHCFTGTGWITAEQQLAATAALKEDGGQLPGGRKAQVVQNIRDAIGKIPGTKATYDALMERRFVRRTQALSGAVYHEPNYILKPFAGPSVTTVHDLSHIRFPQFHQPHVLSWLDELPQSLDRASAIITVSDVVREEVIDLFKVSPERVHTVYEGVDDDYFPRDAQACDPVLSHYQLHHGQYVLLVATLEPRKGVDVLLQAWEQIPASVRQDCPLVLVGSSGWLNDELSAQIARLEQGGTVRRLGYVPDAHLPPLFSGASVFTYPSVYEGFGLPVLDAMASGVPVICREGTSMAEFAEGSCLLCQTGEAEELSSRLEGLLTDGQARSDWGERGREQAAKFSWKRCAAETAEIYRQVAG